MSEEWKKLNLKISGGVFLCDYWLDHSKSTAKKHYDDCVTRYLEERHSIKGEIAKINSTYTFFHADEKRRK